MPTSASAPDLRAPLGLAAALGAGLVVQLALPLPDRSPLPATFRPDRARLDARRPRMTPPFAVAAIGGDDAVLARPLFSPSRAPTGSQAAAAKGVIALLGVASTPGRAAAVLRGPGGEVRTINAGETLAGWRLVSVGPADAVLEHGAEREALSVGGATPGAATPAASVAPR